MGKGIVQHKVCGWRQGLNERWQRPRMSNSGGGQYCCAELAEASGSESWQRPVGVRAGRGQRE